MSNNDLKAAATIAEYWLEDSCVGTHWCSGADTDFSGKVNFGDYAIRFATESPLYLVNNGTCNISIKNVTVGTISSVEQYAAQQLQNAFVLATGVSPAINPTSTASVEIRIGVASRFTEGIGKTSDQAYAIRRTRDGNIELVGNSQQAVLWAVTDFCERVLHVSWPVADDVMALEGNTSTTVTVGKLCMETAPDFERRGWLIGDSTDADFYNSKIVNWMSHNRNNIKGTPVNMLPNTYSLIMQHGLEPDGGTGHNFGWLVPSSTYFSTHPEYFPLINGVRVQGGDGGIGPQLCLSNSAVFNIVVQKAVQSIYSYPGIKVFGIVPNDGSGGWCQCDNCKAWDSNQAGTGVYSNRLIKFVNKVADYLAPYYPGVRFGTLAYSEYVQPPTINVSDNVLVYYCPGSRNYMRKLTDSSDADNALIMSRINGWLSKSKNVALYEYYFFDGMDSCPMPYARTLCEEFPEFKALGIKGISALEESSQWPSIPLFSYVFSRATWDTSLSFQEILADYCNKRYGPAATDMQAYHRLYETTIYSNVPKFGMFAPAAQLLPAAFATTTLDALEGYLTSAEAKVSASGSVANINAVASDRQMFTAFCKLTQDPAEIAGIGSNLVVNPGVEIPFNLGTGWDWDTQSGSYSYSVSTVNPHSGNKSLMITCSGTAGQGRWYQVNSTPVLAGHKYAARFWICASGTGSKGEIWLYQNGSSYGRIGFQDTSDQWVQLVAPEVVAIADNSIRIYVNSFGTGTVQIDDCFLAELPSN